MKSPFNISRPLALFALGALALCNVACTKIVYMTPPSQTTQQESLAPFKKAFDQNKHMQQLLQTDEALSSSAGQETLVAVIRDPANPKNWVLSMIENPLSPTGKNSHSHITISQGKISGVDGYSSVRTLPEGSEFNEKYAPGSTSFFCLDMPQNGKLFLAEESRKYTQCLYTRNGDAITETADRSTIYMYLEHRANYMERVRSIAETVNKYGLLKECLKGRQFVINNGNIKEARPNDLNRQRGTKFNYGD